MLKINVGRDKGRARLEGGREFKQKAKPYAWE